MKKNVENKTESNKPILIQGKLSVDDRGEVRFVNDFDMSAIKRFYVVSNHRYGFVRAWHAHKNEGKYAYASRGSILIAAVQVDNWEKPSENSEVHRFVLSAKIPAVLYIPGGFAHGFKSLEENTQIFFFSTATLQESLKDDYRYDAYYWDPWEIIER